MFRLPLASAQILPPIIMGALLLILFLLPEPLSAILIYDRAAIDNGQYWRLLTGQYIHISSGHVSLNIMGICFIWLLFAEHLTGQRYLWLVLFFASFCSLGMWLFNPEILFYVGFSGVLYALFTWGALNDIQQKVRLGSLLLVGVLAKATYEYAFPPVYTVQHTSNELATAAHFYGVAAALLLWLIRLFYRKA